MKTKYPQLITLNQAKQLSKRDPEQSCVIIGSAIGDSEFIPFDTLNQASEAYRAFIRKNELGARDAGECQIWRDGKKVAVVSYNGNVWQGIYPYGKNDLLLNMTGLKWNGSRWDV